MHFRWSDDTSWRILCASLGWWVATYLHIHAIHLVLKSQCHILINKFEASHMCLWIGTISQLESSKRLCCLFLPRHCPSMHVESQQSALFPGSHRGRQSNLTRRKKCIGSIVEYLSGKRTMFGRIQFGQWSSGRMTRMTRWGSQQCCHLFASDWDEFLIGCSDEGECWKEEESRLRPFST